MKVNDMINFKWFKQLNINNIHQAYEYNKHKYISHLHIFTEFTKYTIQQLYRSTMQLFTKHIMFVKWVNECNDLIFSQRLCLYGHHINEFSL